MFEDDPKKSLGSSEMEKDFETLINIAGQYIMDYLRERGECRQKVLMSFVLEKLRHHTKTGHLLAFTSAYKKLESYGLIKIKRPKGVPFPMTDAETIFKVTG